MSFTERERTETWIERAYRQGCEARLEGNPLLSCPYPRNQPLWQSWRMGWIDEETTLKNPQHRKD